MLEGRKATNQSQFSLGRPLGRLEIYGNDSTLCADTREVATEHPWCPQSYHLQPHQEASEDGWEEISTGEGGRCQSKVVAGLHVDGLAKVAEQRQQPVTSP